jgi:hypothetical protein
MFLCFQGQSCCVGQVLIGECVELRLGRKISRSFVQLRTGILSPRLKLFNFLQTLLSMYLPCFVDINACQSSLGLVESLRRDQRALSAFLYDERLEFLNCLNVLLDQFR